MSDVCHSVVTKHGDSSNTETFKLFLNSVAETGKPFNLMCLNPSKGPRYLLVHAIALEMIAVCLTKVHLHSDITRRDRKRRIMYIKANSSRFQPVALMEQKVQRFLSESAKQFAKAPKEAA